jgi:hypothetical protein
VVQILTFRMCVFWFRSLFVTIALLWSGLFLKILVYVFFGAPLVLSLLWITSHEGHDRTFLVRMCCFYCYTPEGSLCALNTIILLVDNPAATWYWNPIHTPHTPKQLFHGTWKIETRRTKSGDLQQRSSFADVWICWYVGGCVDGCVGVLMQMCCVDAVQLMWLLVQPLCYSQ